MNLASALVKVSRLASAPSAFVTSPAWSTLHDPPLLERRVRRLVDGEAAVAVPPRRPHRIAGVTLFAVVLLVCGTTAAPSLHQLTEALVRLLP